jgi:hypothetical protein
LADIKRMRDQLFFEGPERYRRLSRCWLLPLSAVIAAAGVVGDSTATVIGAMIVAPLMTPILGIVLAVVLGRHSLRTGLGRWLVPETFAGFSGTLVPWECPAGPGSLAEGPGRGLAARPLSGLGE